MDQENEDVLYWDGEAKEAHEFGMLCRRIWTDHFRRTRETSGLIDWAYLDDLDRARAIFDAQYHVALAHRDLASAGLTLADLNQ
jgi:hypothetical protein